MNEHSTQSVEVRGYYESPFPGKPSAPILNSPITAKENIMMALRGEKPCWYPAVSMIGGDYKPFRPRMFPDNYIAHYIMDGEPPIDWSGVSLIQPSWFDTMWQFEPVAGGALTVPGSQKITDINDWETLTFPNLDDYDWEGCARANADYLNSELPVEFGIPTGYWERLMAILPVAEASMALIDEDCQDAVHSFFTKLTDLYVDMLHRIKRYFSPDIILLHDDWGHQNGSFFSEETCREMILPYLKRFVDTVHELGMRFELHCCGKAQNLVPVMLDAGVDLWCPQDMNDYEMLVKTYRGKGILFGILVEPVAPEMPDEVAYAAAKKLVDTYQDAPVAYVNYGGSMKLYEYVYQLSREALSR